MESFFFLIEEIGCVDGTSFSPTWDPLVGPNMVQNRGSSSQSIIKGGYVAICLSRDTHATGGFDISVFTFYLIFLQFLTFWWKIAL